MCAYTWIWGSKPADRKMLRNTSNIVSLPLLVSVPGKGNQINKWIYYGKMLLLCVFKEVFVSHSLLFTFSFYLSTNSGLGKWSRIELRSYKLWTVPK